MRTPYAYQPRACRTRRSVRVVRGLVRAFLYRSISIYLPRTVAPQVRAKEGGWLYANGEVTTDAAGLEGAILNK